MPSLWQRTCRPSSTPSIGRLCLSLCSTYGHSPMLAAAILHCWSSLVSATGARCVSFVDDRTDRTMWTTHVAEGVGRLQQAKVDLCHTEVQGPCGHSHLLSVRTPVPGSQDVVPDHGILLSTNTSRRPRSSTPSATRRIRTARRGRSKLRVCLLGVLGDLGVAWGCYGRPSLSKIMC